MEAWSKRAERRDKNERRRARIMLVLSTEQAKLGLTPQLIWMMEMRTLTTFSFNARMRSISSEGTHKGLLCLPGVSELGA